MSGSQKQHQNLQTQTAAKNRKVEQKNEHRFNVAQMVNAPETLNSEDVLAAQQQVGNQVVQRALDKNARDKSVTDEQGHLKPKIAATIQQKRGSGMSLPDEIRKDASKKLGKDFKNVRIHTDDTADNLSRSISARAFTIGSDIFFKKSVFAPGTSRGRETIIHELTHVVQQSGSKSSGGKLKLGAPDTAMEKEAARMGKKHSSTQLKATSKASASAVQTELDDDTSTLQAQPEEEELQMQSEEELQMQPGEEEEELQMQPDAGGVIQRDEDHDERVKMRKVMGLDRLEGKNLKGKKLKQVSKAQRVKKSALGEIKTKATSMNLGSKEHMKKLSAIDKKRDKKDQKRIKAQDKEEKEQQKTASRNKLMQTIRNPKSSSDDVAAAEEKLNMLHKRSKSDKLRSFFTPGKSTKGYSEQAKSQRKKTLRSRAERGDEDAYKKLKSEQGESKGAKVGGFLKKAGKTLGSGLLSVGKWTGGKALNFGSTKLNQGINHILGIQDEGKSEDKGSEKPSTSSAPSGSSAGGGGGGGGMAEMISELFQENKKLKAQIAELTEKK
jgi:hypothetical protein